MFDLEVLELLNFWEISTWAEVGPTALKHPVDIPSSHYANYDVPRQQNMPTCSNCKKRKVKCDGQVPTCGPCAGRRQSPACDYSVVRKPHSTSDFLPRGDACIPCRRKKKKCNGDRPACQTCIVAKKEDGCIYNDNSAPNVMSALMELERLLGTVCWPPSSESGPQQDAWSDPTAFVNDMAWSPQIGSSPPPESVWSGSSSTVAASPVYEGVPKSLDGSPVISVRSPGALSPTISPQTLAPPQSSKSADAQQDYVDLQTVFIQNGIVLGQSTTRQKWQAVHMGDTSWSVVHPALVHVAQLFGARILNSSRPNMPRLDEEPHLSCALMLLNTMPPLTTADAIAHIQCYCLLAVHFMKTPDLSLGREWLLKAELVVRQFDLHITPPSDDTKGDKSPPQTPIGDDAPFRLLVAESEEEEKRDALCQLLYIDSACSLRMRLPTLLGPQIRQEFDALLLHYMTRMKEASMVVIRMSSIALLQEARTVMMEGLSAGSPPLPSNRSVPASFATTIRRIHLFLADLNELVLAMPPTHEDRPRYLMLQQCTLVPATALASIYHLLSPSHPHLQRKCLEAIADIVGISDRFTPEDCAQLDPTITVCWSVALNISIEIQQQISESSPREGGNYSGVQMGQVPAFIEVLRACSRKVRWPFPLSGGMALDI